MPKIGNKTGEKTASESPASVGESVPLNEEEELLREIPQAFSAIAKEMACAIKKHPELEDELMRPLAIATRLAISTLLFENHKNSGAPPRGPVDKGNSSADDENMNERITVVEKDMAAIKTDVAIIRSNYVTKSDLSNEVAGLRIELHKELHVMTWKVIGASGLLAAAVFAIAKYVH
jgi:membrane protein involved in colicin uptake